MIWGSATNYNGSNTDIQRERRMSEWQRAMKLSPQQREMVQARMIANPYDRNASTRLERINTRVNADPYVNSRTSQAFREALANREYNLPQSYDAGGAPDAGYAKAQQRAAQTGGVFDPRNSVSVGEVNGRRVVAPQAGQYQGFNAFTAAMGLGENPSPEAYSYALDQMRIDPNQRYESDAKVAAANAKARSGESAKRAANSARNEQARTKSEAEYRKKFTADQVAAEGKLSAIKNQGQSGYQDMLKAYRDVLKSRKDTMMPDEYEALLQAANVQYTPASKPGEYPVIVPRNQFDPAKWNPGYEQQNADTINALTRNPGGSRAVSDYMNEKYAPQIQEWKAAAEARNALQAPQAQVAPTAAQEQQELSSVINHFVQQKGMTPEQAQQEVLRRASRDPQLLRRVQAAMQGYGDRIISTQAGR